MRVLRTAAVALVIVGVILGSSGVVADAGTALPVQQRVVTSVVNEHACALINDGTVRCWGFNEVGQLGVGSVTLAPARTPVAVSGLSGVTQITAGEGFTCALIRDGTVNCWGSGRRGALGNGSLADSPVPVTVPGLNGVVRIDAGDRDVCAVLKNGTVKCWGYNASGFGAATRNSGTVPVTLPGALGVNATTSAIPVAISGLSDVRQVSPGTLGLCALLRRGTVECVGGIFVAKAGTWDATYAAMPVKVSGISGATQVGSGFGYHCALLRTGAVECWGATDGSLGNKAAADAAADVSGPVKVIGLTGATELSSTGGHSCALVRGGTVTCWGSATRGQLGDGPTASSSVRVTVPGVVDATEVAVGGQSSCASMREGTVKCWGDLAEGTRPGLVLGLTGVTQVAVGRGG